MDGIEFLQVAAERGFRGDVILLSGMDSGVRDAAGELARVLGLRVAGIFRKPIGLDQLRCGGMLRFCTNARTLFGKIRYYSA
jgi:hypothetical protein